jgi:hypothetical protein
VKFWGKLKALNDSDKPRMKSNECFMKKGEIKRENEMNRLKSFFCTFETDFAVSWHYKKDVALPCKLHVMSEKKSGIWDRCRIFSNVD